MTPTNDDRQQARLRALVRGRVQGVFFRDFTRAHADELGLRGFVRNLADGSTVEVVAQGPRPDLERLLVHLRWGPPRAYVAEVEVHWDEPQDKFLTFQVR